MVRADAGALLVGPDESSKGAAAISTDREQKDNPVGNGLKRQFTEGQIQVVSEHMKKSSVFLLV